MLSLSDSRLWTCASEEEHLLLQRLSSEGQGAWTLPAAVPDWIASPDSRLINCKFH